MSASYPSTLAADQPPPEDLVEVGAYPSIAAGIEHSLVILALGRPCWLVPGEDGRERLLVERLNADAARAQLAYFDHESAGWPPRPRVVEERGPPRAGILSPLVWVLGIIVAHAAQGVAPAWTATGALDAQAVFQEGEWWRPVTALFLHGDIAHLVANAVFGLFVFRAVLTTFRSGMWPWLWLAIAAVAANVAAAAVHHGGIYRSLGASTAVFAGLGLLTGRAVRRADQPHRWRAMGVPLAAGVTLLGLFGAGGPQTDVVAHLMGFGAGLIAGCIVNRRDNRCQMSDPRCQTSDVRNQDWKCRRLRGPAPGA